ncbi:aminodeoxychorismate synthase component I [Amycolatopsis sp. FBCC-B4732]|uniref:aminodeoxychorismate synthase component I n=1 Tax=Amycolatopsis sp. FBCC-B4732 TaxID=3079339 RepID=UPI001FF5ADA2|nr:aminodeoxychorismate synthase component I [Amycolatopsis sp. FBCC-B4732]UOX88287.1 aminodeoxychorismate synthase component I [Amycolatopsis sp. FBCC-B4732]
MRVTSTPLRTDVTPARAFAVLAHHAAARGLPPPAMLSGEWFGAQAVIAPSPAVSPGPLPTVSPVPAPPGVIGGGWFGYLGYDLADPSGRTGFLPPSAWGWADHVLRWSAAGTCHLESLDGGGPPVSTMESRLASGVPGLSWTAGPLRRPLPSEHRDAVKACVHAIEAGELFQANICSRFTGTFSGSPEALFAAGVSSLSPRRAAFLAGPWGSVVSFSPELFLARHGRAVRSTPIKGTLPRRGPADDGNAALLRRSAKDVAENVMITDLVRNDLGRVCEVGSVTVPSLLRVRPAPGVWHLDSTVTGTLRGPVSDAELLAATFPPGSVTGAPKIRALDLIAALEPVGRGVYTGAIGLLSPAAGLELNVAIRTFEIANGAIALGVGGGITADSDPEAEWQECLHKSAPLERLLATGS